MTEKTKLVLKYLQDSDREDITASEIAMAYGMTTRQVDGIFTAAIQRPALGSRVPDRKSPKIKYLVLNEAGRAVLIND